MYMQLDDGRTVDWIHLASIQAWPGMRFGRGQRGLARSGASGFGNDWHYGPHVHVTLRARQGLSYRDTLDFEAYVDGGSSGGSFPARDLYGHDWVVAIQNKLLRLGYDIGGSGADGFDGQMTQGAVRSFQGSVGLEQDGVAGPLTNAKLDERLAAPAPALAPAGQGWPGFPLGPGEYFGPEGGGDQSISGWHSHNTDLKVWQQRMLDRGWTITVDGLYGPVGAATPQGETASVAAAFQAEKGLTVDSLIGPETWNAAWTAPVTPPTSSAPAPAPTPAPASSDNPRGLPTYTPVYPGAKIGLEAPLGDGLRGTKGDPPVVVPVIIDRAIEHHTGVLPDQLDWFSYKNSRSSCPNWFIRPDGTVIELIRPGRKPALTGPEWNWRSVGWEIQTTNLSTFEGTEAQFEAVCQLLAWLRSKDGTLLDGVLVDFKLTREYFINHREALPGTECPGDWWASRMDAQLERAMTIFAEKYATPIPEPTPDPTPDPGMVPVSRSWLQSVFDKLKTLLGGQ